MITDFEKEEIPGGGVISLTQQDDVVASTAADRAVAGSANNDVVAVTAHDDVVAVAAIQAQRDSQSQQTVRSGERIGSAQAVYRKGQGIVVLVVVATPPLIGMTPLLITITPVPSFATLMTLC